MRDAAVGFQCPECVAEGQRGVRQPRTAFGARATSVGGAPVTKILLGLNVAVFLVGLVQPGGDLAVRFGNLALALTQNGGDWIGVAAGEYYRLLTAAFLHGGVLHLVVNMFALFAIGPALEQALGTVRFVALYLLSALGGSVASMLLSDSNQLGVGASGAIFGLFGAYYVVVRRGGGDTGQILTVLLINLVIGFAVPRIDWRAHLGGLVVGALVTAILAWAPRGSRRSLVQAVGCVLVLLFLAALVVFRVGQLAPLMG